LFLVFFMKKTCLVVAAALAACVFASATATTPSLACTLHPGGLGERQEVVCALRGLTTPDHAHHHTHTLLLLLPLPPAIGPDSAWLAAGALAGTGGVVACGDDDDGGPPPVGAVGPCPALTSDASRAALARCVPPAAATSAARFHLLTTRLASACADEAVAARASPVLVVARASADGAFFRVAVRARLARPDPRAWVAGAPAPVALPPPFIAAFHASNGSFERVVATADGGASLAWSVPAPGGLGGLAVGALTAAAAVASAAAMVRSVVVGGGGPPQLHAKAA
jgi:hypothetical protein